MATDILSGEMQSRFGVSKARADVVSQLTAPCAMQLVSTPLHLYGLDIYNRAGTAAAPITTNDRVAFIQREYTKTALARMARIFPAFGIGGVTNKWLRKQGRSVLAENYYHPSFVPK